MSKTAVVKRPAGLTPAVVAKVLGIRTAQVNAWIKQGAVPVSGSAAEPVLSDAAVKKVRELVALGSRDAETSFHDETRLQLALKAGRMGLWEWDIPEDRVTWSDSLFEIQGVRPEDFSGDVEGFAKTVHPEDKQMVMDAIQASLEKDAPYELEFRAVRPDGRTIWLYTHAVVNRADGKPISMVGAIMDITERKQAVERFRLLADNMDQLAWMAEADGQTVWFSKQWECFSGIPVDQLRERAKDELHHPDHYERVTTSLRAAAERGESWEDTFPLKSRKGDWHWFLSRVMPVKNAEGKVERWFGTSTDITTLRAAQEKVQQSEERFRMLSESMPQLAWMADAEGRSVWFNKQWEEYTGLDIGSVPHADRGNLLHHPDHIERVRASHERGMKAGKTWEDVFPLRGRDGDYRWFLSRLVPVRDDKGSITCWFGTCTDITSQREAEQAAQRLAAIVESSDDAILSKDLSSIITTWNRGAERIFGYTADEAVGKPVTLLFPPGMEDEEPRILERIKRGERIDHYDTVRMRKDGTMVDVSLSVSPMRDSNGRVTGASKIVRDVTERRRMQEALVAGKKQLEMITDHMPVAVARCSRDGRYLWVSRGFEEWTGLPAAEITGKPIAEVMGAEGYQAVAPYMERVLNGERCEFETQVGTQQMGKRWVHAYYAPVLEQGTKPDGWIAVITDITHRKELEEALQEEGQRKDHFLAVLAHELRSPLAPLQNGLHVLELSEDDKDTRARTRAMMARQLEQMVRLVNDLLDLSRISRGKVELRKDLIDLGVVINDAVETVRTLVERKSQLLEVSMPEEPLMVNGDNARLNQVVTNLLTNASKFTSPSGRIRLVVERSGEELVLSVKDDGMGIEPGSLEKVFDMFAQLDPEERLKTSGGLGIGLHVVRQLTGMHGGRVYAQSEGKGRGSSFFVHLPLAQQAADQSKGASTEQQRNAAKLRVMVVDDNEDAVISMALILRRLGHEVGTAYNGKQALDMLPNFSPDLVLMDIGMPDMNGYEACARMRELPEGKKARIVALSGWGQEEDRRLSAEAGFDRHLVKPIDRATLTSIVA